MTLRPPLFSPTYTPFPFMARFRSPRQRNAPSIRGFATATSPWLRHREEVRSGLGNHRADLARELLAALGGRLGIARRLRSEEHTSELQSLMRISYAVFCLKQKNIKDKKEHYDAINDRSNQTIQSPK